MAELNIEVAYVSTERQFHRSLSVAAGTSLKAAISQSGLMEAFPELALERLETGIFGKKAPLNQLLSDGDRVEVYRPLIIDPKEARRSRAARKPLAK